MILTTECALIDIEDGPAMPMGGVPRNDVIIKLF
jgi:hypothetical protein